MLPLALGRSLLNHFHRAGIDRRRVVLCLAGHRVLMKLSMLFNFQVEDEMKKVASLAMK